MKETLVTRPGMPQPKGAVRMVDGINFALFSRHARAVSLVLEYDGAAGPGSNRVELDLDPVLNKTGDIWHVMVTGLPERFFYGYRLNGPFDPGGSGHWYDPTRILLDPYARALRPASWGVARDTLGVGPCCLVDNTPYDWQGDRPLNRPLADTIIYELHVRGFTAHPSSGVKAPGTFQGLVEKIPYLQDLGVSAVELMPVTEFDENEVVFRNPYSGERLKNFWGYSPLSFFAPKAGYCAHAASQINEFRDLVRALHRAGIEVILDMVFNHTAEGGMDGPVTGFRGIDNTIYYLLDPETRDYLNFSGCGNTVNCNHPIVRNLIMQVLRWWVVEMHVDGFRFDLASILGRDQEGRVLANPPVVEQIAEDPVLADTKIIAEAWDAAGLYQVGNFSTHHRWAEWNGRFRDDARGFMCGYPGRVAPLATRIAGSSDLYGGNSRRPCNSINFITSHDGFTLLDLVSYNEKHNLANGEENRDGENNNISWNSGAEGETDDPAVMELRKRRLRTMAVILLLSQGVPMLVAGDEFGRSQKGNNNAWCQDNEISWLDWDLLEQNKAQFRFFRKLIHLRRQHPVFRRHDFFAPSPAGRDGSGQHEIIWQATRPGEVDWSDDCRMLAFTLNGSSVGDDDFFIMLNGNRERSVQFEIPAPPKPRQAKTWRFLVDTGAEPPLDFDDSESARMVRPGEMVTVPAMGSCVLQVYPRRDRA